MKFVLLAFLFLVFKINENLAFAPRLPTCGCKAEWCRVVEPCTGENEFGKIWTRYGE